MPDALMGSAQPCGSEAAPATSPASAGLLTVRGQAGPLVLALDAVEDAMRQLDQQLRRQLGVRNIDVLALQYIDRQQRRGGSTRVRDLGSRLGVSSGTATTIAQRLERAHLVESADDPIDGRGRTLVLAVRAHDLVHELLEPVRTDLDDLAHSLTHDQETELIELLNRVNQILRSTTRS